MSAEETHTSRWWTVPEVLVPFVGLVYSGLYLISVVVPILMAGGASSPFVFILVPFIILFLALGFGVWKRNRFAYVGSIVLSVVFLFLEGSFASDALASPSDYVTFFGVVTVILSLVAVLVYSIAGVRMFWKKPSAIPQRKMMASSGSLALVIVGFIVGALVIGALAGATESRLLGGATGDIAIVSGASNTNNAEFYHPGTYSVAAGTTVSWVNRDGTTHTVTSNVTGSFDSGVMQPGGTYSLKFNTPGTYSYYCTIHPWMKAKVVVTP